MTYTRGRWGALAALASILVLHQDPRAAQPSAPGVLNPLRTFGVTANNVFFYYSDVERAARFYTEVIGLRVAAGHGYAKIFQIAGTCFLALVDAAKGTHVAEEPKTTAIAPVTDQLEEWYRHIERSKVPLRGPMNITAGRPHDGLAAIDPEGYFLEFERFNLHQENAKLMLPGPEPDFVRAVSRGSVADSGLYVFALRERSCPARW